MAPSKANQAKIKKACKAMNIYGISAAKVRSALKDLLKMYEYNWMYIEEDNYKVLLDVVLEPDGPKVLDVLEPDGSKQMEIVKHDFKLLDEPEEEEEETEPLKRKSRSRSEATSSTSAGYICENEENLLCLEYINMDSETNKNEDENENEDEPPSPCFSEIDVASSLNGEVKLTFSICKPPPRFQVPSLDAVIKHVDDIYGEKFGTEFSISQLLKDVCQCFMEQGNASDHVGYKIPSFDNFKEPEKEGGPTIDPTQIPRVVVTSEFDYCGKKLRQQEMVGTDELSGSSSLTIFLQEKSTVDLCMEQGDESNHVGYKISSFDNLKEPDKQGGPTSDPTKITRFVVSREFDHYISGGLRKQQMVEIDQLSCSKSLTVFQNEQSMVDHCMEQENGSDHVGNMIPCSENFKEPEKEGGPTDDPMQISRFEVATEFDNCLSENSRKQQMVGSDQQSCSSSLTFFQNKQSTVDRCSKHYFVADITRGLEKQEISLINEVDDEKLPTFTYIQTNVNYNAANVKFMLARISDENSCQNCFGDCLSHEVPCACVVETGGEFAYTSEGLVDEKFLKNSIDVTLKPTKEDYFYCDNCPIERMKKKKMNQSQSSSCKGHLVRKFIKECWYKCGCGFNCGNRVVQRGIQAKLQVFMTHEGKGWGLRTLEDLPKGKFVCEYVGEIVTNSELFERNEQIKNEKHTYPVLLDADWSSEGFLKDEEALCLDATSFGNVARFINHRCVDANLVEIPVEVESPDHHYYHHAFFTTREVKAMEELTWDYGIDFNDDSHPVKAFSCKCGSKFCKAVKRYKRSRRGY